MRLTIAYSKIKKRNLVLINNDTYQRETLSERPIRQPLRYDRWVTCFCCSSKHQRILEETKKFLSFVVLLSLVFCCTHFVCLSRSTVSELDSSGRVLRVVLDIANSYSKLSTIDNICVFLRHVYFMSRVWPVLRSLLWKERAIYLVYNQWSCQHQVIYRAMYMVYDC